MKERITIKDYLRESHLFNNRVVFAGVVIVVLSLIIVARLIYLQVVGHEYYTTLSNKNRVDIVPIPPTRGLIYDRRGTLLAQNLPSFSLEITPERVADLEATLQALRKLIRITDNDLERFRNRFANKRRFEAIPLRLRLSDEEVARFSVDRHRFPGVEIAARLMRDYPLGALAVHAIGYIGRIDEDELQRVDLANYSGTSHIGKTGVEKQYESVLHGTVGHQAVETNAQGRVIRVLERTLPTPGGNLYLTIDADLQRVAEAALGDNRGAVIAIVPKTGEIVAFASLPGFDPNPFVNGIEQKDYDKLAQSPDHPLFNRILRGQYPPGSTIKPFIGLAGLEYNVINARNQTFCPGWYALEGDDRRYRDWRREGHGVTTLAKAIYQSCDVYFYDLAFTLGIDRMYEFMSRFGFGRSTGIDIAGEVAGLMPSREWKRATHRLPWFPGETIITGIGQGFMLATPLQLAHMIATLANRGASVRPRLAYAIQDLGSEQPAILEPVQEEPLPIVKAENWETIIDAMQETAHNPRGTAYGIGKNAPYRIAGKTGTAQVFGLKEDEKYVKEEVALRLRDHAMFIAFAPAGDPQIAIAVIVENGGSGGLAAAPVARAVMDKFLKPGAT